MLWQLTDKQKEMALLFDEKKYSLAVGQGRSGKTLLIVTHLFRRALKYPGTNHAIFRNTLASAIDGVWAITVKEVIQNFFPVLPYMEGFKINESTHEIVFPNRSRIVLKGLDNKDRVQKLLSTQFATVFFDEAHLISYEHFGLLMTRMPQPLDADYRVQVICAANWAPKTHWLKTFFSDGLNPETKAPHAQSTGVITSTTADNTTIDAKEYIETLNKAGDRRSRLACAGTGFYEEVEGALWMIEDIQRAEALQNHEYDEIVLGYDPAVTAKASSDGHGIAVAGKKDGQYHVLYSWEGVMDINDCAKKVCSLYHAFGCSKVVAEVNNGGDFVPALLAAVDPRVFCELVRATRGKITRAEPIAAMYKSGLVFHTERFRDLEDQMVTFAGQGESPNSLDALVWALKQLSESSTFADPLAI